MFLLFFFFLCCICRCLFVLFVLFVITVVSIYHSRDHLQPFVLKTRFLFSSGFFQMAENGSYANSVAPPPPPPPYGSQQSPLVVGYASPLVSSTSMPNGVVTSDNLYPTGVSVNGNYFPNPEPCINISPWNGNGHHPSVHNGHLVRNGNLISSYHIVSSHGDEIASVQLGFFVAILNH